MRPEEIKNRYSEIISKYKQEANFAYGIYTNAAKTYNEELEKLQEICEHRAPKREFIDGVACPYCHKIITFKETAI